MSWRLRATLHFKPNSGLPTWGQSQLAVRLTHAFDPNKQQANEEASFIKVEGDTLIADLFLETEALAVDTFNTFTTGSITAWLAPDTEEQKSFVDYHQCNHDGVATPCVITQRWEQA